MNDAQKITAWIQVGTGLVGVIGMAIDTFKGIIKGQSPGIPEEELNAILVLVSGIAKRGKARADMDVAAGEAAGIV